MEVLLAGIAVILTLTAETALGSWSEGHTSLIYVLATVCFVGGVLLAMRWLSAWRPRAINR